MPEQLLKLTCADWNRDLFIHKIAKDEHEHQRAIIAVNRGLDHVSLAYPLNELEIIETIEALQKCLRHEPQ